VTFTDTEGGWGDEFLARLRGAVYEYFHKGQLSLRGIQDWEHADLRIGPDTSDDELDATFHRLRNLTPFPDADPDAVLYFDIETHSADERWDMAPEEFFRLGQYAWGPFGDVHLVEDYHEFMRILSTAQGVVGHNIHAFDLSVLFGKDSMEPLYMALDGRVFDTMTYANLVYPAPNFFKTRAGHLFTDAAKPEKAMKWLGLDNLCFQLGLNGKVADLKDLAKEHGGFGNIPLDDPTFREYSRQDVRSLQELTISLLCKSEGWVPSDYSWREQLSEAINMQMSRNGFAVDAQAAQRRADELAARKEELLAHLEAEYGFPTEGKQPWRKKEGKVAIIRILLDQGVDPRKVKGWPRLKTAVEVDGVNYNVSLGGKVLKEFTQGTDAEELGATLAELMGQRSLAQLALDSMHSDGRVHPDVTALQRSGRRSMTKPGMTIWTARGAGAVEKSYFVASPGHKLVEMDYSAADNRAVAALSGDERFMERFQPGADAHEITGRMMFGDEVYDSDPKRYRTLSKPITHGGAYGAGAAKLAAVSGLPEETTRQYIRAMAERYPKVDAWKRRVTLEGERGYVVNSWGRRMIVEPDRACTMSPALYGQSTTTEIFKDGLCRIAQDDPRVIGWLVACVHDAAVWDIPDEELEWAVPWIQERMQTTFRPDGGMPVEFPMSTGHPADNWLEAGH